MIEPPRLSTNPRYIIPLFPSLKKKIWSCTANNAPRLLISQNRKNLVCRIFGLFGQRVVARRPVLFSLTDQPLLRNRPTADSGPVRAFVSRNACAATKSPALSGNENESQLSFYRFWCLVFHKTKKVKMEVGLRFPFFVSVLSKTKKR